MKANKNSNKFTKFSNRSNRRSSSTSWNNVARKYNDLVGESGQYFHEKVILPKIKNILNIKKGQSILDFGCGQGVLSRFLGQDIDYTGIDLSKDLISFARKKNRFANHRFEVGDITKQINLNHKFDFATIVLALQNVEDFSAVFENASNNLKANGKFIIVINHPYFRIPRNSGWGIDEGSKKQYRKIYSYMSPQKISIDMTPGGDKRTLTWSFHAPLQDYVSSLSNNKFTVERIEEWVSEKSSVGKAARMENRARSEFPMFMCIVGRKI